MERNLHITGKGKATVKPDIIIISFDVRSHEMEYEDTIENLNRRVNDLRDVVECNGLDRKDLKTTKFRINKDTIYVKKSNSYEFNGFIATHDLKLSFAIDQKLINSILVQISKIIEDINFSISFGTEDREIYEEELIRSAIRQAKETAKLISEEAGVALKEIINIDYSFNELHLFSTQMDYAMGSELHNEAESTPDIEPEDFTLSENINVTWRIE